MKEEWREIEGGGGVYFVSNKIKVKSIDHKVLMNDGRVRTQAGRIITMHVGNKGYLRVCIKKNGVKFTTSIHRLMALSFIPNPENKPQVNHIDGNKSNNSIENLEWCTNIENHVHARKMGLMKSNTCEKHHMAKLTNNEVKQARIDYGKGLILRELSDRYGVSISSMSKIVNNQTYIGL